MGRVGILRRLYVVEREGFSEGFWDIIENGFWCRVVIVSGNINNNDRNWGFY